MTEESPNASDESLQESSVSKTAEPPVEGPSEAADCPAPVTEPKELSVPEEEDTVHDEETETPNSDDGPLMVQDDAGSEVTVESVIEAVLFASDEPISGSKLAGIVEQTSKHIRLAIRNLNQKYEDHGHAFRIDKIAGGWQMLTLPYYMTWLKKLVRVRGDNKLSPAALEALAIVAYKQPVIRADMEAIRGVACGEVLRSLMAKGLVKMVGRREVIGRPMQYGTTKKFLEIFGLDSLKDLPTIEELKRPAPAKTEIDDDMEDEVSDSATEAATMETPGPERSPAILAQASDAEDSLSGPEEPSEDRA